MDPGGFSLGAARRIHPERRRAAGTWLLLAVDADVSLSTDIPAFLLPVVAVALVGGLLPAVLAPSADSPLNHFFTTSERSRSLAKNPLALFAFPSWQSP
jgi:two-component system sensor histidine kinase KdpD